MQKEDLLKFWSNGDILGAIVRGRREVQEMVPDYKPEAPHLNGSSRADASTFDASTWEELIDILVDQSHASVDSDEKRIIFTINCVDIAGHPLEIGTERHCRPLGDGPWTVIETDHGLMVSGLGKSTEERTHIMTAVFTNEGTVEKRNYVLATLHPGLAEEPADLKSFSPGDKVTKEMLSIYKVERVVPTNK